jgi:CubicO group peptidase (beta-lactamase class C family)
VLLLQQDGKLNINDPVSKYLADSPKTWEKITLANLLGHTSGIPSFTDLKEFGVWRMSSHTTGEELALFRDKPLDFEPGSKFAYSNSNFEVLGAVIERVIADKGDVKVLSHGGGIEGFNTSLMYAPDRRTAVIVLGNVNGGAPGQMSDQLFDVVLGKSVVLANEHKAVPIAKEELAKFVGVYDLAPTFSLTVAVKDDALMVQGTNQPAMSVMYQGLKDGHPTFYAPQPNAEIEFVPDATGAMTSLILHQGGQNMPAKKH